jgi:hypothetical protein
MKTIQTIFLLSVATASAVDTAQQTPSAYSIIERGQSYNIWEKTALEIGQAGQSVPVKHRYTELASGLNYKDANGSWISSQEQIVPQLTGGAAATQGPHTVSFPYDLYTGAIEQVTPEGLHLRSRPLLIAYASGTNSQLIAELTNSIGQITPAGNAVIYTNCTTDFASTTLSITENQALNAT